MYLMRRGTGGASLGRSTRGMGAEKPVEATVLSLCVGHQLRWNL